MLTYLLTFFVKASAIIVENSESSANTVHTLLRYWGLGIGDWGLGIGDWGLD
ncbi:MAG: hypothetical protein HEQ35_18350 [Gloeotrichia echinulata IR180]|nr:hypothetical protein [Gloeotrichia echinulata DEX184]